MNKREAVDQLWREFRDKLLQLHGTLSAIDPDFNEEEFMDEKFDIFVNTLKANKLPVPSMVFRNVGGLEINCRWSRQQRIELEEVM